VPKNKSIFEGGKQPVRQIASQARSLAAEVIKARDLKKVQLDRMGTKEKLWLKEYILIERPSQLHVQKT